MEPSGKYCITRHEGVSASCILTGTLIYSTVDDDVALRFYNLLRPSAESTIALWHPDGRLIASKVGPRRQVSV
jgi:hypothetical protein